MVNIKTAVLSFPEIRVKLSEIHKIRGYFSTKYIEYGGYYV